MLATDYTVLLYEVRLTIETEHTYDKSCFASKRRTHLTSLFQGDQRTISEVIERFRKIKLHNKNFLLAKSHYKD